MELRLQQWIDSMVMLSDIRNLDYTNSVVVILEHPTLTTPFVTVASVIEPSFIGIPINATWVVMDPLHTYYKQALKLKSALSNELSEIPGALADINLKLSWILLDQYDEIFEDPQYYLADIASGPVGPQGEVGPAGPQGERGLPGPEADIDYDYLVNKLISTLTEGTVLSIVGESSILEGYSATYKVQLVLSTGPTDVNAQIDIGTPVSGVSIDSTNTITVESNCLSADQNLNLKASYEYLGKTYEANEVVVLRNAAPIAIKVSGLAASIIENKTATLNVLVEYNSGDTLDVTNKCTYSSSNTTALQVSATGGVTSKEVTTDTAVRVDVTYVEGSVTLKGIVNTVVKNVAPKSLTISGVASLDEKTNTNYTATVTYTDSTTENVTASTTFGVVTTSLGTFDTATKGLFHAADVTSDVTGNISATYTASGVTVTATKSITVKSTAVGIRPYYGTALLTATKNAALILGFTDHLADPSITGKFTLNSGSPGSGITMFFAYPTSYGLAKFEDQSTPGFYGGWDGALGDPFDPLKSGPLTVDVTIDGVVTPFYLYQTDYDGLGSVTWAVSPA